MANLYAVKCLLKNDFEPAYKDYASFDEVTVLIQRPDFFTEDEPVDKSRLMDYMRDYLEDSYENADGVQLTARLFYIAGVQEVDDPVSISQPLSEIYRWFYRFDRLVSEEEFLKHYYFDDLGRG